MKVKILPSPTVPVIKCNHRFGAKMTFSHQTDSRIQSSIYAAELLGFKNNVRIGAFITNLLGQYLDGVSEAEETGLIRHDIYYGTDYWKNPITGELEVIPDYYATTYTSAGAEYFDVEIGQPKIARRPRHGQDMFDISNGRLGYDFINGVMGNNGLQEVYGVDEDMQEWFKDTFGRYPSSLSYRNGDNGGALVHLNNWISGRNSTPSPSTINNPSPTQYGSFLGYPSIATDRNLFINYPSSWRWWDAVTSNRVSRIDADNYTIENIQDTLANGGWYRDFCHWHSARANNTLNLIDEYLSMVRETFGEQFVWTCSNGEAMEYMFIREITNRVVATERNGKVTVVVDIDDKFKNLNTGGYPQKIALDRLNIPLSVEVDLSGTTLSGKDIIPSYGKAVSLGNDRYIIEIPFNHKELFQSVYIEEGEGGIYNTGIPNGIVTIEGNNITIETDMPTKAVLFGVIAGGNDYDSMVEARSNVLSFSHTFSTAEGRNYRIGIISEFGQANLIEV